MEAKTYNLTASNGRHIRKATMVVLDDGRVVRFMEKMTKRQALRSIEYHTERGNLDSIARVL